VVRTFAFPVALFGVVACAAVLGIDERSPVDDGPLAEAGADAPVGTDADPDTAVSEDARIDTFVDPGFARICDPISCNNGGGACNQDNSVCVFDCTKGRCPKPPATVICPPGNDCQLECNDDKTCETLKCTSGKSCTFNCSAKASCKSIGCTSDRCEFFCAAEACPKTPSCNSKVCVGHCTGASSCKEGVDFTATESCGITCSGKASCSADKTFVKCNAPDASIECAEVMDSCKLAKPTCLGGGACSIRCGSSSCDNGVCCNDAGSCMVTPTKTKNACP